MISVYLLLDSIPNQPNSQTAIRTEPQTGVMIELLTVIMTNP